MATENPVFQILAPTGNQALLAAGNRIDALAIGQLGVINYHTGLSVDGSVPQDCNDIFLVVGMGSGGVLGDIKKSAGQMIQVRHIKDLTVKGYVATQPKIVEVTGFKAKCETDYTLKVEMRNQQSYGANGYNPFTKIFNYYTGCCTSNDTCDTCPQGDCVELALGLMNRINADPDKLLVASLFANRILGTTSGTTSNGTLTITLGSEVISVPVVAGESATQTAARIAGVINSSTTSGYRASYVAGALTYYPKTSKSNSTGTVALTNTGGTGVTFSAISAANVAVTDTVAFSAANPGVCPSLRITGANTPAVPFNGNIPIKYYSANESDLIVSLTSSFDCKTTVTTVQDLQYADGNGNNLKLDEYMADGYSNPYRTSSITGLQKDVFSNSIDVNANYNVVAVEYDIESVGGWLEYKNNIRTIIAVPCADSVTLQSIATVFDLIFTKFGAMTNDVATMDCTNTRTGLLTPATDGIESLA